MSRRTWAWARLLGGALILAAVVWRLGSGPLLDGLRSVSVGALAAALAITAATTVCAAWRWQVVARGLGLRLPLGAAIGAYYRSQFLNTVLPGGVVGDVHRGVDHGRRSGEVGIGLRAVAWERLAGQLVQLAIAGAALLAVLLASISPAAAVAFVVIGGTLAAVLLCLARLRPGSPRAPGASEAGMAAPRDARTDPLSTASSAPASSAPAASAPAASTAAASTAVASDAPDEARIEAAIGTRRAAPWRRVAGAAAADVRGGLLDPAAWPAVVIASTLVVAGHAAIFVLAARVAGVDASILRMLPIVLLLLLAMAIPLNIGGWGPREGAAAWLFGVAGLGARLGVSAAAAYGVMVLVASLPGAVVMLGSAVRRRRAGAPGPIGTGLRRGAAHG